MSASSPLSVLRTPLRALQFVRQCGASSGNLVSMLALLVGKAGLDTLSALLLAATLSVLMPPGRPQSGWYQQLQAFADERFGVPPPVLLLLLALVVCKGILTPLLLIQRGRLIDRWTLLVSMRVLENELAAGSRQRPQVHAQASNVAVNFMVPRVVLGAIVPSLDLLTEVTLVSALLAILLVLQPLPTSILILALLVAICVGNFLSRKFMAGHGDLRARLQILMLRWVADSVASLRELRLYQRVPALLERYRPVAMGYSRENACERTFLDIQSPAMELFFLLVLGAAVLAASEHSWQADLHVLALFSAVGLRLIVGFRRITIGLHTFKFIRPTLVQLASTTLPAEQAPPAASAQAPCAPPYLLVCESLYYCHPGASQDVIHGLDCELLKGEWIGLVGESGVGKSTLVDLLIGELEPRQGRIQWPVSDGAHSGIGYASAMTTLIPGTLRDNVAFLGENHDTAHLLETLRIAGIESLLDRLPQGLDTQVEVFEQRISSGERQRIGLARALLHARSLLILDEATAALDQAAESRFLQGLRLARPDLAVLLVTHRLSALQYTERQLLMIDGALKVFVTDPQCDQITGLGGQSDTCI